MNPLYGYDQDRIQFLIIKKGVFHSQTGYFLDHGIHDWLLWWISDSYP